MSFLRTICHLATLVLLCWSTTQYMSSHLDLSPLYGPGGVKSIAALVAEYPQRDWGTWMMNLCMGWAEDEEGAARLCIWLGYVCTVIGISLCGFRLTGWSGARVGALLTLCFAPLMWNTLLVGPDGIATGVAWLGIGLAWSSTKGRWWWSIPLCCIGAFCCIFAAKIKITALPCAAYLGVVPLLAMKPKWWGKLEGLLVGVACAGTLLYLKQNWMPSANNHVAGGQAASLSLDTLELGWKQLQKVFDEEDVIVQLTGVALIGAVLPGRNWFARTALSLLCAGVLCITASTLGMKIRPRYFVAAELPILILTASSLTQYRWFKWIGQIGALGIASMLWLDTLAYHAAWSDMMTELSGSTKHSLMDVPDGWKNRYTKFPRLDHDDHSTIDAKTLHTLAKDAPTRFVFGVPLRDGREHHLEASGGLGNHKTGITTPKFCCEYTKDLTKCAEQTVDALLRSNARLILPVVTKHHNRIPNDTRRWYQLMLYYASQSPGWTLEGKWGYLDGSGAQKPPCDRPPRRKKGFWEIDGEKHHTPHSNSHQRGLPDGQKRPQQKR